MAWSLPSDARWIRSNGKGLAQFAVPPPGALAAFFRESLALMRGYVAKSGLRAVLTPADVDACIAGDAGVVFARRGRRLSGRQARGARCNGRAGPAPRVARSLYQEPHRRLPDRSTHARRPERVWPLARGRVQRQGRAGRPGALHAGRHHAGARGGEGAGRVLARLGRRQRRQLGRWRGLPSAAHLARAGQADRRGGRRRGLWGLGLRSPGPSRTPAQGNWTVGRGDARGYARELASLVGRLGEDHVTIGSDLHGVGPDWSVNDYGQVRSVVEALQGRLSTGAVEKVTYGNYARVLKAAMAGRS